MLLTIKIFPLSKHVNDTIRLHFWGGIFNINSQSETVNLTYFPSHGVSWKIHKAIGRDLQLRL